MTTKYKLKQAKWILDNETKLRSTSCPPFDHVDGQYQAGCKHCIVYLQVAYGPVKILNLGCSVERKLKAANEVMREIRKDKLKRINGEK
jgi:hypothetical protein